ncbi:MAG: TIGR03009 domain-containing protein, partial [Planctomycetota bacterium]
QWRQLLAPAAEIECSCGRQTAVSPTSDDGSNAGEYPARECPLFLIDSATLQADSIEKDFDMSRSLVQRLVAFTIVVTMATQAFSQQRQPARPQRPQQGTPQTKRTLFPQPAAQQSAQQQRAQPVKRQVVLPKQTSQNPYKLTPQQQKRLETLLEFWEKKSNSVKTYSCQFVRWEYDSVFGPQDPKIARQKAEGVIRYVSPDKGEFKIERSGEYKADQDPKNRGTFPMKVSNHEEHWICDGRNVFELDGKNKQLRQEKLPPEMQGQRIADGPLPFMFGARKEKLLARYWMRELVPPNGKKGEYWFEAQPKFREDAANYQRIRLVLDEKEYLPKFMEVFPPAFDGRTNWSRTVYAFTNRKVNDPLQRGQQFLGRFISPTLPRGWKKVVSSFGQPAGPAPVANGPRRGNVKQAMRPGSKPQ